MFPLLFTIERDAVVLTLKNNVELLKPSPTINEWDLRCLEVATSFSTSKHNIDISRCTTSNIWKSKNSLGCDVGLKHASLKTQEGRTFTNWRFDQHPPAATFIRSFGNVIHVWAVPCVVWKYLNSCERPKRMFGPMTFFTRVNSFVHVHDFAFLWSNLIIKVWMDF